MRRSAPESSRRGWPGPEPFDTVLERAKQGDEEAFACLWKWLHPALVGWLHAVAPGSADDAAAETWLSVTTGLPRFEGDAGAFRSWVFTIAKRRAVDEVRAAVRRPQPDGLGGPLEPAAPQPDPSIAVAERSASEEALGLLGELPPAQAQVVALRVVAGLSVVEVAQVMGRSEGAVRVLAHRGVQALGRLVGLIHLVDGLPEEHAATLASGDEMAGAAAGVTSFTSADA